MQGNGMGEEAQNLVLRAFKRHDITLHIDARSAPANQRLACILGNNFPADDGCMGGGGSGSHNDNLFFRSAIGPDSHDHWDDLDIYSNYLSVMNYRHQLWGINGGLIIRTAPTETMYTETLITTIGVLYSSRER